MRQALYLSVAFVSVALGVACTAARGSVDYGDDGVTTGDDGGSGSSGSGSSSGGSSGSGHDGGRGSSGGSSGKGSSSGGSTSSGGSSGKGSSSGGSTSSSSGSTSSSGGTGDSACVATTTGADCSDCCANAHQAGAAVGDQAYGDCLCQTPGTCATECANSFCAGSLPQPGDTCDTCMQGATACDQAAVTACEGNADCKAFEACMTTANCDNKP